MDASFFIACLTSSIMGLTAVLGGPVWANPTPPELPALNECLKARTDFPVGRAFYTHFFALTDTTADGVAEFCLSFIQDPRGKSYAIDWLQRSAAKGLPDAQLLLGSAYESGTRVDQDAQLARYWYEVAAHQHFPHAQYELATIYYSGQRLMLPQDFEQAYFWNALAHQSRFAPAEDLHTILAKLLTPDQRASVHAQIHEWNRRHAVRH